MYLLNNFYAFYENKTILNRQWKLQLFFQAKPNIGITALKKYTS